MQPVHTPAIRMMFRSWCLEITTNVSNLSLVCIYDFRLVGRKILFIAVGYRWQRVAQDEQQK
jgi:hypothetical protein